MLTWFIKRRLAAFEREHGYDASYLRWVLDHDVRAFLAFAKLGGVSSYHRDVPLAVYYAVKLVGAMHEDCGPCTQLVVGMALGAGVTPTQVSAIVRDDPAQMIADVRLAVAFAKAALAHAPEADTHREAILAAWGPRAVISLGFALASARLYPTLKYALGYGKACQRVEVGTERIVVGAAAAA